MPRLLLCALALSLATPAYAAKKADEAERAAAAEQQRAEAAKEAAAAEQQRAEAAQARKQALADAYQREIAWLASEKKALQQRIAEVDSELSSSRSAGEASLAALQGALVETTLQADQAEGTLAEVEDQLVGQQEDVDRLNAALEQAEQTLGSKAGADTPGGRVSASFALARDVLARAAAVSVVQEGFFLGDGTKTEGSVVQVGEVARFGVAGEQAGALVPVGGGRWKLHGSDGEHVARALAKGEAPPQLGLFLVENPDKPLAVQTEKSVLDVVEDGGTVGLVIIGLGFFAVLLMLLRGGILLLSGRSTTALLGQVEGALRSGQLAEVRSLAARATGPAARLLGKVLDPSLSGRGEREEVLEEAMLEATGTLGRFATPIAVIAAVAPLLGLLGTVTGMIATFDVITTHGTGDPKMLSGGISAALVTTELGLVVAIPCLLVGSLLSSRANTVLDHLERTGLEVSRFASNAERDGLAAPRPGPTDGSRGAPVAAEA